MCKKIIIFSQSSADIQYVLTLYEKYHRNRNINIFCNDDKTYIFLKLLKLNNCNVVLIDLYKYNNITNIFILIYLKIRLYNNFRKYFRCVKKSKIIFFSNYYDYIGFYFLAKLSKNNQMYFIDIFKIERKKIEKKYAKEIIKCIIYLFITNIIFYFSKAEVDNLNILTWKYKKYNIKKCYLKINNNIFKKYCYDISNKKNKKMVIFIESNDEKTRRYLNYKNKIDELFKYFYNNKIIIAVKPHPAYGYSKCLKKYIKTIIPQYVPMEFINLENIIYILGISSAALAYVANKNIRPVISIIDIIDVANDNIKKRYKNYLYNLSKKIIFIDKIEYLDKYKA